MIALYAGAIELAHNLNALVRIRVITDEVTQADKMCALLRARILEDSLGRLEIGVEIAEDGKAHGGDGNLTVRIRDALIERNVELVFEKFQTADQCWEPFLRAGSV